MPLAKIRYRTSQGEALLAIADGYTMKAANLIDRLGQEGVEIALRSYKAFFLLPEDEAKVALRNRGVHVRFSNGDEKMVSADRKDFARNIQGSRINCRCCGQSTPLALIKESAIGRASFCPACSAAFAGFCPHCRTLIDHSGQHDCSRQGRTPLPAARKVEVDRFPQED